MKIASKLLAVILGGITSFATLTAYQKHREVAPVAIPGTRPVMEKPGEGAGAMEPETAAVDRQKYLAMDALSALKALAKLRPANDVQSLRQGILDDLISGNPSPDLVKSLRPFLSAKEYRPFLQKVFAALDGKDGEHTAHLLSLFETKLAFAPSRAAIVEGLCESMRGAPLDAMRALFEGIDSEMLQQNILSRYCKSGDPARLDAIALVSLTENWAPQTRKAFIGDLSLSLLKTAPGEGIALASKCDDPTVLERVLRDGVSLSYCTDAAVGTALQETSALTRSEVAWRLADQLVGNGKSADELMAALSQPVPTAIRDDTERSFGSTIAGRLPADQFAAFLKRVTDSRTRENLLHGETRRGDPAYSAAVKAALSQ